jgi:hypothetical protein
LASGFKFQFPEWHGAAKDLVQRWLGQKQREEGKKR